MANIVVNIRAGGIFSKYMTALQNILIIDKNCDEVYLRIVDPRYLIHPNRNPFDYVLEQTLDDNYESFEASLSYPRYGNHNPIELSKNFSNLREIVEKIKIKDSILNKVDVLCEELDINNKTLGVHVRLTDMNIYHSAEYGKSNIQEYISEIKKIEHQYKRIFVASDNFESIEKLKNEFGNKIVFVKGMIRGETEDQDTLPLQLEHCKNEKMWIDIFVEMLLLSKCGSLLIRTSNVSNIAILYADNDVGIKRI